MNKVEGYLENKNGTPYGKIGTETLLRDIEGIKLYVGDLVELYDGKELIGSNKPIINSDVSGFCVMGIAGCCKHDGTIIDTINNWRVKLLNTYNDVEDGFEADGGIIYHIEKQKEQLQTEFTYQEVIAKIKDGETYSCSGINPYYVESISREGDDVLFQGEISDGVGINLKNQLFKLQEPKQECEVYTVENNPCGTKTKFKSSLTSAKLNPYSIVVCRTKDKDNYYGRIIELGREELTKEEYNKLPSIVGIVN